jgi:hypothetical protein
MGLEACDCCGRVFEESALFVYEGRHFCLFCRDHLEFEMEMMMDLQREREAEIVA